ncbi:MAG: GNAT family N-acetyltransferase [Pseudomonadota bacterium]
MSLIIDIVDPGRTDVQALIAELDAYQSVMYPAESNHLDGLSELQKDNVRFFGTFDSEILIACGAIKFFSNYGEIKRVFVPERWRGRGIAKKLMAVIESAAIERQCYQLKLETGIYQPEAIGLYEALGYTHCTPFGNYTEDPMSVFMEKNLEP